MKIFRQEVSDAKLNAQINLAGLSLYADDCTLKFHKSRVNTCVISDNGLLLAIVESYAVDMNNTKRLFRPVIFNIAGTVLSRNSLEDGFKTSKQAISSMWDELDKIDAVKSAYSAIDNHLDFEKKQARYLRNDIDKLIKKTA
jgi:hypothetical protein